MKRVNAGYYANNGAINYRINVSVCQKLENI